MRIENLCDHKISILSTYLSCNRYRQAVFLKSGSYLLSHFTTKTEGKIYEESANVICPLNALNLRKAKFDMEKRAAP